MHGATIKVQHRRFSLEIPLQSSRINLRKQLKYCYEFLKRLFQGRLYIKREDMEGVKLRRAEWEWACNRFCSPDCYRQTHSTEMVNRSYWWLRVSQKLKNFKCFVYLKCTVWSGNKSNWLLTSGETACMCVLVCVRAYAPVGDAFTVLSWHSHSHICYGFEKILKKDVLAVQRTQEPACTTLDYVKVNLEYTITHTHTHTHTHTYIYIYIYIDVLLPVHLSIILAINQLNAQNLLL